MKLVVATRLFGPCCSNSARVLLTRSNSKCPPDSQVIELGSKEKIQRTEKIRKFTMGSICLLVVPIGTFWLGVWQVKRYQLRRSMIADVNSKHKPSDPDYPAEKVEMLEEKSMKNVSYVLTWFGISGATTLMWWSQFIKKRF